MVRDDEPLANRGRLRTVALQGVVVRHHLLCLDECVLNVVLRDPKAFVVMEIGL